MDDDTGPTAGAYPEMSSRRAPNMENNMGYGIAGKQRMREDGPDAKAVATTGASIFRIRIQGAPGPGSGNA